MSADGRSSDPTAPPPSPLLPFTHVEGISRRSLTEARWSEVHRPDGDNPFWDTALIRLAWRNECCQQLAPSADPQWPEPDGLSTSASWSACAPLESRPGSLKLQSPSGSASLSRTSRSRSREREGWTYWNWRSTPDCTGRALLTSSAAQRPSAKPEHSRVASGSGDLPPVLEQSGWSDAWFPGLTTDLWGSRLRIDGRSSVHFADRTDEGTRFKRQTSQGCTS